MATLRTSQRHSSMTGNNAHDYERRMVCGSQGCLWIPGLISGTLKNIKQDLQIGPYPVFEEVQQGVLISSLGLNTHLLTSYQSIPVAIVDNHNYVFPHRGEFFSIHQSVPSSVCVIHIDQHADMNEPSRYLNQIDLVSTDSLFDYTRDHTTIASFIRPALQLGWINDCIQVRSSHALYELSKNIPSSYILDIDLDFRDPRAAYSPQEMDEMIALTQDLMSHAFLITIATSPLFIDQSYALSLLDRLFGIGYNINTIDGNTGIKN